MTCKPDYKEHAWGRSLYLTPLDYEEEVVLAWMMYPFIYSSVHYHEYKKNKIICNAGAVQVDLFPRSIKPNDLMKGRIEETHYDTEILLPGDHIEIESNKYHRICSVSKETTLITEIYLSDYPGMYPDSEDIVRAIPGGQIVDHMIQLVYQNMVG